MKKILFATIITFLTMLLCACGDKNVTDNGLKLELQNDNTYKVISYAGDEKNITIPESHNEIKITSIGSMSFHCSFITDVTVPNTVTSIESEAFASSDLKSILLPDSIKTIGEHAFDSCKSLKTVTVPNSVETIGKNAFFGCTALESISLPFVGGSASATEPDISTLFGYIFGGYVDTYETITKCHIPTSLKNVTITGGKILDKAFRDCNKIQNITIGDGVTYIGTDAFSSCTELQNVIIGKSVTSIGDHAFSTCTKLNSITIPKSVESIGRYAFSNCVELASATFEDTSTWYITKNTTNWSNKTNGTLTTVTNKTTNASILSDSNLSTYYSAYYWYKK